MVTLIEESPMNRTTHLDTVDYYCMRNIPFKFNLFIYLYLFFFIFIAPTIAQPTYRERADSVIAFYQRTDFGKNYYSAMVRLKTGVQVDRTLAYLVTLFQKPQEDARWMFGTIGVYLHGEKNLSTSYKNKVRMLWKIYTPLCKNSEHEQVMYYTSLYLASEWFDKSDGSEWFNGKSSEENKTDAQSFLQHWFNEVTANGMEEFDSPSRTGYFFASMFLLYDFAKDETIKKQAEIMIDWLLADYAAEYLDGMYCGAHSSEPEYLVPEPRISSMAAFGSLFFGDVQLMVVDESVLAALSTFTPPKVFQTLATNRKEPYIHTEIKRSKEYLRGEKERRRAVYKYTYMTENYAMGSLDGGLIQPNEQHSWDVSWKGKSSVTTVFGVQPFASDTILSRFYSQDENTNYQETAVQYTRYVTYNKNSDGSPFERIFQHKNTLITLYDIPPIKTFPIITAFFPKALDKFVVDSLKSRWIFCQAGDVYVAYFPFKGYVLLDEEAGRRFVSPDRINGCICQVSSKKEAGSFKKFMSIIKKSKVDLSKLDLEKSVTYSTINNDRIEFSYSGVRKLNDSAVSFDTENLFQSKWMNSKKGSGVLSVTDGKNTLTLNMKNVKIEMR